VFAGRSTQLERLTRGLEGAEQGRAAAFALIGEPGIGKTRLATELSNRAQQRGLRVCWGRAWEAGGAPSLWPWRQLLEAAGAPLEAFEPAVGAREFAVADPEQARFAQFRAVLQALEQALEQGPLLCVLDDLHAADLASIDLAAFVLRSLRTRKLCLVCTWRDREANQPHLREAIARLGREVEALALERLSADDCAAMVREAMGVRGDASAGPLYRATSGNPLFLVETLRSLSLDPGGALTLEQLPVAEGISAVVRQRAAKLDERQRALLGAAAVIGREGELELWAEAFELRLPLLERELPPLFATGLLARAGPKSFTFSHALVRDAVEQALEPDQRDALHHRLALALDARVAAGERHRVEPRAHHALLTTSLAQPQVSTWTLEAVAQLRSRTAWEAAVALVDRALALVQEPLARVELALARGWALGDGGQTDAMKQCFRGAAEQARTLGDPALFTRAVLGLGSYYLFGTLQNELIALLDEAADLLGDTQPSLHARLMARKAAAMTPPAEGGPPLELARAAVREAARGGDARTQLEVAVAAGSALGEFAPADQRVPVNTELVRLARDLEEPVLELRGVSRLFTDHLELGELARADAWLLERQRLVTELQLARFDAQTPIFRSMRAMGAGDFETCDAALSEVRADDFALQRVLAMHRFWLGLYRDDSAAIEAVLPEVLRTTASIPGFNTNISAAAKAQRGDLDAARAELGSISPKLEWLHATMSLSTVAYSALALDSEPHLRATFELLQPRAHLNSVWGLVGLVFGPPVSMTLGSLAAALGRPDDAKRYFAQAHARVAATQARAHGVWVHYRHGVALLGPLKEPAEGRRQLEAARTEAEAVNMPGLARRAAEALQALQALQAAAPPALKPAPLPSADDALTIVQQGADWCVRRGAKQVLVPNMKGMPMLAELVAHPHREIGALELIGEGEGAADAGDSGALLDEQAKAAYRARARELAEELEEATELGQVDRADDARDELELLRRELSRAVDVKGRDRRGNSSAERARIAARRRLRDAIARIGQADAELGQQLEGAVRTGAYCAYAPNARRK
jgi:AAA ATPase domain